MPVAGERGTLDSFAVMKSYLQEARGTLSLGFPLILGMVGQMAIQVIDTAMLGRVGVTPVAAAALAGSLFHFVLVAGFGLCAAIQVFVSQALGGRREGEAGSILAHGLVIVLAYSFVAMGVVIVARGGLGLLDQPAEVVAAAQPYLLVLALGIPITLPLGGLRAFYEGQSRVWLPLAVLAFGATANIFLNWVLIFGNLGAPALGLVGAGIATVAANALMLLILLTLTLRGSGLIVRGRLWPAGGWRVQRFVQMLHVAIPSALQILFEVAFFATAVVMMGWLGKIPLAAHQIAIQYAAMAFMMPLGLSFAITVRVARAHGAGDLPRARRIGFSGMATGVLIMLCSVLFITVANDFIPRIFLDPSVENAAVVLALASQLLWIAAVFQVFDGLQVTALAALRGLTDVRVPTVMIFTGYWLLALPTGYALAFTVGLGPKGVWLGLVVGLMIAAFTLTARFARKSRDVGPRADFSLEARSEALADPHYPHPG